MGLCLTNLHNAVSQDNGDVHSKAVSLVRNLLTSHDTDPRCSHIVIITRAVNEASRSFHSAGFDLLPVSYDLKTSIPILHLLTGSY